MSRTIRYLWVVQGIGLAGLSIAAALMAFAIYLQHLDPKAIDQVFAITFFLQGFAASTGYSDRARRGHLDPVLVGGVNRSQVAVAHWLVSCAPGLLLWNLLGCVALLGDLQRRPLPFNGAATIAMLYASTAVWVISLRLPRYSGAILWFVGLFVLAATQHLQPFRVAFNSAPDTWLDAARATGGILVFPVMLLVEPGAVNARLLSIVAVATVVVWFAGAALIESLDTRLSES